MVSPGSAEFDYILIGGGLQNALIALSLIKSRPHFRVGLVEAASNLGGNHVWCFHQGDLPESLKDALSPLVEKSWDGYDVFFPDLERRIETTYSAITSVRLNATLCAAFAERSDCLLSTGTAAVEISEKCVLLADGRRLAADTVISSLGPTAASSSGLLGYQKFLGLELELEQRSPRVLPLLIDARVPQRDGFRFFYVLPFSETRVLVEDTYFSDSPALDADELRIGVLAYCERNGYRVRRVLRQETGVLPLPTRGAHGSNPEPGGAFLAGYQGGWFHPTTGYSFPAAARVAELVTRTSPAELAAGDWNELLSAHRRQFRSCAFLNRLLFSAFAPEQRYHAIERFYRLPESTLQRFYAMTMTRSDWLRMFCGKPPRGFSFGLALSGGSSR